MAICASPASGPLGSLPSLAPPEMNNNDFELLMMSGLTRIIQCFQSGRSTSLVVSHA